MTSALEGVSVTPRPFSTPGKDPVPIVQETGWALGPVWTGAENLVPTGIFFIFVRIVYFVVLVSDEGRHAVDFSSRKNPTASVGSEPAILGTRGQHANP
jgi:hypothetical protein